MSALVVKGLSLSTSGPTQLGDPHLILISSSLSLLHAIPRSVMQIIKSFLSIKSILSGFRSRCIMFFLCIKSTAKINYAIIVRISSSVKRSYLNTCFIRDPYFANFITRAMICELELGSSSRQEQTLSTQTIFLQILSSLKKLISLKTIINSSCFLQLAILYFLIANYSISYDVSFTY